MNFRFLEVRSHSLRLGEITHLVGCALTVVGSSRARWVFQRGRGGPTVEAMDSDDVVTPGMSEQLDSPSYQGLATFGMRPFITEASQLDALKPDIAVVGAPWDGATTNRPGARFGPRALRANAYDPGTRST